MKNKGLMPFLLMGMIAEGMRVGKEIGGGKDSPREYEPSPFKEKTTKKTGQQGFKYGDTIIYALNKRNADRKAKNMGLI